MVIKKQKEKDAATPAVSTNSGTLKSAATNFATTNNSPHRIDLAERQVFGIIFIMESAKGKAQGASGAQGANDYLEQLKKIAGD